MTRSARRRWLVAACVATLLSGPTAAYAAAGPTPEVTSVTVEDGSVRAVVRTGPLPAGTQVDVAGVRVTAGGKDWPAAAHLVDGARTAHVQRTAVMAVDTSGSMGAGGIADAQAAGEKFLDVLPPDVSVGLVTFADAATLVVPPTTDRTAVRGALAAMRPAGNTRLYDGIMVALDALGQDGDRAVVVLSDGKDTASEATVDGVAARLAQAGVRPSFVAFRTEQSQVDVLNSLAIAGGGSTHEAATGTQLVDVFASAGQEMAAEIVVTAEVPEGAGGTQDIEIAIPVGTATAVAPLQVELPPAPVPPSAADTPAAASSGVPPAVVAVAFGAAFVLFAVLLHPATWRGSTSQVRTREVERYSVQRGWNPADVAAATPSGLTQVALQWADRAVQKRELNEDWALKLDRAGIPLKPQEWLLIRLSVTVAAIALAVLLLPWWFLTGLLAGVAGWVGTGLYARIKAKRRTTRFAEALPDMLQITAGSLRSGFSLPQAIDNAAKDGEEPIAGELSRALAESRLGVPLEDALDRVADRMASTDLRWTIMAIRIAREVGGNLAEVMLSTTETMRERGRIQRQVKALSAEGKLSAYILLGLPAALTLFMVTFRRAYISLLVTDPIGWVMVVYAVLSVAVGAWAMSRVVKLEV